MVWLLLLRLELGVVQVVEVLLPFVSHRLVGAAGGANDEGREHLQYTCLIGEVDVVLLPHIFFTNK